MNWPTQEAVLLNRITALKDELQRYQSDPVYDVGFANGQAASSQRVADLEEALDTAIRALDAAACNYWDDPCVAEGFCARMARYNFTGPLGEYILQRWCHQVYIVGDSQATAEAGS